MKKLIGILFLSVFCFGTKATTVVGKDGENMEVLSVKQKMTCFHSDHGDILFYNNGVNKQFREGSIMIYSYTSTSQDYERIKQMIKNIKGKTKMTLDTSKGGDANGIIRYTYEDDYSHNCCGYKAYLTYKEDDIDQIYIYGGYPSLRERFK